MGEGKTFSPTVYNETVAFTATMNCGCQKCSDVDRAWVFLQTVRMARAIIVTNDRNFGREDVLQLRLQTNLY